MMYTVIVNGKKLTPEEYAAWGERQIALHRGIDGILERGVAPRCDSTLGAWPMTSDAMGIHPDAIAQKSKEMAEAGCQTEYTKLGQPIFRSRKHRKRYCELHGFIDRDGGDGDPGKLIGE